MRWAPILLALLLTACDGGTAPILEEELPPPPTHAAADAAGLDGVRIARAITRADSGDFGEIRSLLISKQGELVVEEYYRDVAAGDANRVYSVTKSVASALVGIALFAGQINSLEDTLAGFYPTYTAPAAAASITLENLLTMRAGFEWDEWSAPYGAARNSLTIMGGSADWIQYMLDLPLATEPGTSFTYSTGVSMLLSGIIEHATGMTTEDYADATLFEDLSLGTPEWRRGPHGMVNTGSGLLLTPRQMLRFGEMFEQNGRFNGVEVVPRAWVDLSTSEHTTTGNGFGYGFQWWRFRNGDPTIESLTTNDIFFAWGWGGQFIFVVPHKDVVIVSTAGNFDDASPIFDLLAQELFPAL